VNTYKHLIRKVCAGILSAALLTGCTPTPATIPPATGAPAATTAQTVTAPTAAEVSHLEFPLSLEDSALQIESLFPFDGINPDCGNQEGASIASIKLRNSSDRHLTRADILLTLADGTELRFRAEHIAPGQSGTVFCDSNTPLPPDPQCMDVRCTTEFAAEAEADGLTVQVSGLSVALTNNSGRDIKTIVLYCHNMLGDEYFGGIAYPYEINGLPAGETTTLNAADCLLGIAGVSYLSVIYE
jgi:hypothetical protein